MMGQAVSPAREPIEQVDPSPTTWLRAWAQDPSLCKAPHASGLTAGGQFLP